jgi:hypothetical protein
VATGIYGHADQRQPEASEMLCLEAEHVGLFKADSENKKGEYVESHVMYYRVTKNTVTS